MDMIGRAFWSGEVVVHDGHAWTFDGVSEEPGCIDLRRQDDYRVTIKSVPASEVQRITRIQTGDPCAHLCSVFDVMESGTSVYLNYVTAVDVAEGWVEEYVRDPETRQFKIGESGNLARRVRYGSFKIDLNGCPESHILAQFAKTQE